MAMGSTGAVNITPEMMKNALSVISDYRAKTDSLHTELSSTVSTLLSSSFSGAAADGFKVFYETKIEELLTDSLPKLIQALEDIVQGTLDAIPGAEGLDDQLGDGNKQ